jgi:hypothetical protein
MSRATAIDEAHSRSMNRQYAKKIMFRSKDIALVVVSESRKVWAQDMNKKESLK